MTKCNPTITDLPTVKNRNFNVNFQGGNVSSDGGSFLLNLVDNKINLISRVASILDRHDQRQPSKVQHKNLDLTRQRVYALACGYEISMIIINYARMLFSV